MKYIVITGGVISGIGKWVTAASVGFFLSEKHKITPIKMDGYLNVDPWTMNPKEHGEVFVLKDGAEVDMDFGHYERFLGQDSCGYQSITMGKIYRDILEKERRGDYLWQTVQLIPHVTNLIQDKIKEINKKAKTDICMIEIGGTVGDIETELFIEAIRQMKIKEDRKNFVHIHLTYAPIPAGVKEQKTKPTQQSVQLLHARGLFPDFIFVRGAEPLTENNKKKIALFSNLDKKHIISVPDVESIYTIPMLLKKQGFDTMIRKRFWLKEKSEKKLETWEKILSTPRKKEITIGIVGKYTSLEDSYSSVVEAIRHSSRNIGVITNRLFFDAKENISLDEIKKCDGIIIPWGFWDSAIEEMIRIIQFARENKIPTLGICLGLQLMIIEYARNILGISDANSREFEDATKNPVITLLNCQSKVVNLGGTMRLWEQESILKKGQIEHWYKKENRTDKHEHIKERFRHRYEVNPEYVESLEKNWMHIAGVSKNEGIVQFIELEPKIHPYFVATQSHPELTSRLENPAPLFMGLLDACIKKEK